jgi:hypothetical protein
LIAILESQSVKGDLRECAASIENEHTKQWKGMWKTDVILHASEEEYEENAGGKSRVETLQDELRLCLYAIYSSVRRDSDVMVDVGFEGAFGRAHWVTSLMLYLHPDIGRSLVERSHNWFLEMMARSGSKTGLLYVTGQERLSPYTNVGFRHPSPVLTPPDVIAAYLVINAWNSFRTTLDFAWLSDKGFDVIGSTSDFLAHRVVCEGYLVNEGTGAERRTITDPQNFVTGHRLTDASVLLAMEYAIEAARVLDLQNRSATWKEVHAHVVQRFVLKADEDSRIIPMYDTFDPSIREEDVAEVMALFSPPLERVWKEKIEPSSVSGGDEDEKEAGVVYRRANDRLVMTTRLENQHYYDYVSPVFMMVDGSQLQHPYNIAWKTMTLGAEMRASGGGIIDSSVGDAVMNSIEDLYAAMDSGGEIQDGGNNSGAAGLTLSVWNSGVDNGNVNERDAVIRSSDMAFAACVFVETFLTSMCGRKASGGVGKNGFRYEQFRNDVFKIGRTLLPRGLDRVVINLRQVNGGRVPSEDKVARGRIESRTIVNNGGFTE